MHVESSASASPEFSAQAVFFPFWSAQGHNFYNIGNPSNPLDPCNTYNLGAFSNSSSEHECL
eukprot:1354605-Amorphochlora_amoeboformis.AAC.1